MSDPFRPRFWNPCLSPVQVRVWTVSVAAVLEAVEGGDLSPEELTRAERYRFKADARRFCASRLLLRRVIGDYLGIRPGEVRLVETPGGKPEVFLSPGSPPVFFSLSRSGDFCTVAVSGCAAVGVDIEKVELELEWEPAAKAWLSEEENLAIGSLGEESCRRDAFFRLWCAREAAAKALGLGLSLDPLASVSLEAILEGREAVSRFRGQVVEAAELEAPKGYRQAGAVAHPPISR